MSQPNYVGGMTGQIAVVVNPSGEREYYRWDGKKWIGIAYEERRGITEANGRIKKHQEDQLKLVTEYGMPHESQTYQFTENQHESFYEMYQRMIGTYGNQQYWGNGKPVPEKHEPEDIFPNHFIGYRQFVITDDMELKSCGVNARWIPGKNIARCQKHPVILNSDHVAPVKGCECGLYAVHSPQELWYNHNYVHNTKDHVVAAIQAWGRMQIQPTGFRAQFAQVGLLVYDMSKGIAAVERIKAIAEIYKCRAVDETEFLAESQKLGDPVPENQRPKEEQTSGGLVGWGTYNYGWEKKLLEEKGEEAEENLLEEKEEEKKEEAEESLLPEPVRIIRERKNKLNEARMKADERRRKKLQK